MSDGFYRAFEDRHRGSREVIKSRLQVYLAFIQPLQSLYANCKALDVGCGRGEWLELLMQQGFDPIGVDLDEGMLAACTELGLPAEYGDAIAYLQQIDDESLTVVSGFHIAEHIPFDSLQRLVAEALRVLKPGGLLILETPNAENITVGTQHFYLDPTHEKPIPSQLLAFLTEHTGFIRQTQLGLQENPELHNPQIRLNLMRVLDGVSPDYAVIAQKDAPAHQLVLFDAAFAQGYGLSLAQLVARYQGQIDSDFANLTEQLHSLRAQQAFLEQQRPSMKLRRAGRKLQQRGRTLAQNAQAALPALHPKNAVRWPLRKSLAWVVARPKLRHQLNQGLQHIPWLHARLLRFARHYSVTPKPGMPRRTAPAWLHAELPFTPYVQQLSAQLLTPAAPTTQPTVAADSSKPTLAFVSPLPDQRTGIADYSAELLPVLAEYYDIYVITEQSAVQDAWINAHCHIRDAAWLRTHAHRFERVIYQIGNSHFHAYMLPLMQAIPGIVVLHDFYLSGLFSYVEAYEKEQGAYAWSDALYTSHGYLALQQRFTESDTAKYAYPVNFDVLAAAQAVIVHSDYAHQLARQWYGSQANENWAVIPHLRVPAQPDLTQAVARQRLGIAADHFVICSFGFLNPTKLNHRLLEAWLQSDLAQDPRCLLIFVGENYQGEYGVQLRQTIKQHQLQERVLITGFMEGEDFKCYLAAADMAVQLRTHSRGESSGTVLDCMNYGLPLIINANGSMAEIDAEAVYMLPDDFTNEELASALQNLWQDSAQRERLSQRAKAVIAAHHAPAQCAQQYAEVIEQTWQRAAPSLPYLVAQAAAQLPAEASASQRLALAERIAQQLPPPRAAKRLFLDITATSSLDLKTGIERVARALLLALLASPPTGYRIEPVYLTQKQGQWVYQHARQYTLDLLDCPPVLYDDVVDFQAGDQLLGLDISGQRIIDAQQSGLYQELRQLGVRSYFMLYDLLPLQLPEVFPAGAADRHEQWLHAVAHTDGVIAISQAVLTDFAQWREAKGFDKEAQAQAIPFAMHWLHLGADIQQSAPSTGLPESAHATLAQLKQCPTFLMVGTIEPRKNHLQALRAFEQLWAQGVAVNLVIVGNAGWQQLADAERRTIPETLQRLKKHPQRNQHLFWLAGISDEYLEQVYEASSCLLMPSLGEGFGLPLIEAAQYALPILARDLAIFREVAGEHAYYFTGDAPTDLADAVQRWLRLYEQGQHPTSTDMPWQTWQQSAAQLSMIMQKINPAAPDP